MIHTSYFGRIVIGSRCYLLISWRIHIIGWLLCSFLLQASLSVVLADQLASFSPSIPVQFSILSSNTTCTDNVTDPVQAASSFLVEHYNLVQNVDYIIKDQYQSSSLNVTHIYLKQLINQLPIINGDAAIHVDQCGCVVAFSTSFRPIDRAAITATKEQAHANMATIRIVSPYKALAPLANLLNYTVPLEQKDEHDIHVNSLGVANAALSFDMRMLHDIPFASGSVKVQSAGLHTSDHERVLPVWSYQLATPNGYYHVQIAMMDPRPELQRLVEDPADLSASPHGWHARQLNGQLQYSTETVGNNVYAQENKSNRSAAEQEANLEMAGQRTNGGDHCKTNNR
ncbi:hypothetical protein BDF22DRAFT_671527 [Syncephalis plumigaleata]|nr:hypothetical protein BDF22DRAFT_671527 [Syncephalis plumigaleata]